MPVGHGFGLVDAEHLGPQCGVVAPPFGQAQVVGAEVDADAVAAECVGDGWDGARAAEGVEDDGGSCGYDRSAKYGGDVTTRSTLSSAIGIDVASPRMREKVTNSPNHLLPNLASMWHGVDVPTERDLTIKATGHKVWCTDGRKPEGYRKPAAQCTECGSGR